jgi:hypothetical protein
MVPSRKEADDAPKMIGLKRGATSSKAAATCGTASRAPSFSNFLLGPYTIVTAASVPNNQSMTGPPTRGPFSMLGKAAGVAAAETA